MYWNVPGCTAAAAATDAGKSPRLDVITNNLDVSHVTKCMLQLKCDLMLSVSNRLVDMVMEGLSHLASLTTDLVAETGDGAGEVLDTMDGDKDHVGGVDRKSLGSPLHLVCLNLQGLDVEGDLDKVVALGHLAQSGDVGADVIHEDTALLTVLEDGASTAENSAGD